MRRPRPPFLFLSAIAFAVIGLAIGKDKERAAEVGDVDWGRDLDAALASSKESGKPVFVLFQEVPG